MARKKPRTVNKSEACRYFGCTRYEFDKAILEGMPYVEAPTSKGGQWKVDLSAAEYWFDERAVAEAERQRRINAYYARLEREREAREAERWKKERARLDAELEARRRADEKWRRKLDAERLERQLFHFYRMCREFAYEDYGSPLGAYWPNGNPRFAHEDHPQFMADWPFERPTWWMPSPEMLELLRAEPPGRSYSYKEPFWRELVPRYVPGQPWPWRKDDDETDAT